MTSLALRQANEMVRLERRNVKLLNKIILPIIRKFRRDRAFVLRPAQFARLELQIRDSMIEAHILGKARVRATLPAGKKNLVAQVRNFNTPISLSISKSILRRVTPDTLELLRQLYGLQTSNIIANLTTSLNEGVRNAVQSAVESGLPVESAVVEYFSNVADSGFGRMKTLVRTATQITYGAVRQEEYEAPEIDEILWGYQYTTVGDHRVRESHAAQDGVRLPKDDPFWQAWWAPNGWNCRCQVIPLFEKERIKRPNSAFSPDTGFAFSPKELRIAL